MTASVVSFPRYGIPGYYSLADLPQSAPIRDCAFGTGWSEFDEIFRMYPGQFVVVTGKPGHGKSTFLLNIVVNCAKLHGTRTFMHVPENERLVIDKLKKIYGDSPDFNYFAAQQCYVQSAQIEHYDGEPRTLHWVLDKAANAVERDHVELIIIDPWNELERTKPRDVLLTDYINDALQLTKQFVRHYQATLFLVAHPTKAVSDNDRIPSLADIEGSMNWWNKCDNGLVVHRDNDTKLTRVISAKVREEPDAGRIGARNFYVDGDTGKFTPLVGTASEYQPPPRQHYGNRERHRKDTRGDE